MKRYIHIFRLPLASFQNEDLKAQGLETCELYVHTPDQPYVLSYGTCPGQYECYGCSDPTCPIYSVTQLSRYYTAAKAEAIYNSGT